MGDKINAAPSWKYELAVKDYPKLQQRLAPYEKALLAFYSTTYMCVFYDK